ETGVLFYGRIRKSHRRFGHDGNFVFWRLDPALVWAGPCGASEPMVKGGAAHRDFSRQDRRFDRDHHVGAMDAAAFPLRPVNGFRLAPVYSAGPGEYPWDRRVPMGH